MANLRLRFRVLNIHSIKPHLQMRNNTDPKRFWGSVVTITPLIHIYTHTYMYMRENMYVLYIIRNNNNNSIYRTFTHRNVPLLYRDSIIK